MSGHNVKKLVVEPGCTINLTELERGTYLLEISLPENQKRLKLIQF